MSTSPSFNPAFRTRKGETDTYNGTSPWYWVLHIMLVIYGLGYLASLAISLNTVVPHTHFKANNNGPLYSDRYTSAYWLATFFSSFRIFVFLVVCSLILYRNTQCCGRGGGCTVFWIVLLVGLVLLELFNFTILTNFYVKCNGIDQVDNPCNDLMWCCVGDVYTNPSNLCSNTIACAPTTGNGVPTPTTLAQLKPNTDFIWMFSVTVAFLAFDAFFLMLPIGLWLTSSAEAFMGNVEGEDETNDNTNMSPAERAFRQKSQKQEFTVNDFLGTPVQNQKTASVKKRIAPITPGSNGRITMDDLTTPLIEKMEERKFLHEPKMTKQP